MGYFMWDRQYCLASPLQSLLAKGGKMFRYWISVILPVLTIALFGCGKHDVPVNTQSPPSTADNSPGGSQTPAIPIPTDRPEKGKLTLAVVNGDDARVSRLLEMGADINENVGDERDQITPLLVGIALGNERIASSLIIRGATVTRFFHGYSAADFADYLGQKTVIESIRK
jgi:hypothetical protein